MHGFTKTDAGADKSGISLSLTSATARNVLWFEQDSEFSSGVPASSQSSLASQWKCRLIFETHNSITYMQALQIERYILSAKNEDVRSLGFQIQIQKP